MKCPNCGKDLRKEIGDIEIADPRVGVLRIQQAEYWECSGCGTKLYTPATAVRIDEERRNMREELIKKRPIGEFITLTGAAHLLGVSKQAVHKNRKLYSVKLGRKPVYLKKSVIKYKETQDGRFPLVGYDECYAQVRNDTLYYGIGGVPAGLFVDQDYTKQPIVSRSDREVVYAS